MTSTDTLSACDRLISICERALALEDTDRGKSGDTIREPLVAFVLAQLRMRVRPALSPDWPDQDVVHIALMGGTNSGKSTLVNVCLGRAAAGMRITARYSQCPEAYRPAAIGEQWLHAFPSRFAGYEYYQDKHPPRHSDTALARGQYEPRFGVLDPADIPGIAETVYAPPATQQAVCWDAPDYSTEEARAYLQAVLDAVALADVVIVAVTDESYADDRGRMLYRLVRDTGVAIHVVANKLDPSPDLLADVKEKYVTGEQGGQASSSSSFSARPAPELPPVTFHHLPKVAGGSTEERLQALLQTSQARQLRTALGEEEQRGPELKRAVLHGAMCFLEQRIEEVFRPLEREAEAAAVWERTALQVTQVEFFARYQKEYLDSQRYGEFNQALVYLMELLEVPWIGRVMKALRSVIRVPFRLVSGLLSRVFFGAGSAQSEQRPEYEVMTELFTAWLPALKAEAQQQASTHTHPAWAAVVQGLDDAQFRNRLTRSFETAYQTYQHDLDAEVQRRSREIYTVVEQNPTLLHSLRGANLAVDAATLVLVIQAGGIDWSDAVVGPIVAGLRRVLLDAGLEVYLETQKRSLQQYQKEALQTLVGQHLLQPVFRLFAQQVQAKDIEIARQDFALVSSATREVAVQR